MKTAVVLLILLTFIEAQDKDRFHSETKTKTPTNSKASFNDYLHETYVLVNQKLNKVKTQLRTLSRYLSIVEWDDIRLEWENFSANPNFYDAARLSSLTVLYTGFQIYRHTSRIVLRVSLKVLYHLKSYSDTEYGTKSPYNPWFYIQRHRSGDEMLAFFVRTFSLSLLPIFFIRYGFFKTLLFILLFSAGLQLYGYESVYYLYLIGLSPVYVLVTETIKNPVLLVFFPLLLLLVQLFRKREPSYKELTSIYERLEYIERHLKLLSEKVRKLEKKKPFEM